VIAIVLCFLLTICCLGAGRSLAGKVSDLSTLSFSESTAVSAALGLALAGCLIFIVGTAGLLALGPIAAVFVLLGIIGIGGTKLIVQEMLSAARQVQHWRSGEKAWWVTAILGGLLMVIAVSACIACYKPPTGAEWDAVAYHLADPAQFILHHRVFSIPTEHHSNFPLLIEMLYTAGLLFNGYALANMMHLVCSISCVLAVFGYTAFRVGTRYGMCAALALAATPVVFWESTVGYVEMGLSMFTTLSAIMLVRALSADETGAAQKTNSLLRLSGLLMGCALGVKYLALIPAFLSVVIILAITRDFKKLLAFAVIASIVGCPWYVKNAIVTHNPVYPYFYKVFTGSKYWSADIAKGYEAEQQRFGQPHSLKQPPVFVRNLLQAPWDLLTLTENYSNPGEDNILVRVTGTIFALNGLLIFQRKLRKDTALLLLLALAQLAGWFMVAQVGRYVLNVLPLLAITGAAGAAGLASSGAAGKIGKALALGLVTVQTMALLAMLYLLDMPIVNVSIPGTLAAIKSEEATKAYLTRHLDNFPVFDYLNSNSRSSDGVALYDETLGFYLHRPYMWANEAHSTLIPYASLEDGAALTRWLLDLGYKYAVINMNRSPHGANHDDPEIPTASGNEQAALQKWYANEPLLPVGSKGYRYRGLLADAIRKGLWTDMGEDKHGVVLLKIGAGDNP
jgi:4-amino-4-deoxy-L-arabinose transferase-like glycosyltransferase